MISSTLPATIFGNSLSNPQNSVVFSPSHSLVLSQNQVVYLIEMNIEHMSNEDVEEALTNVRESFSLRLAELKLVAGLYENPLINSHDRGALLRLLEAQFDGVSLSPMRTDPMIYTDARMFARHVFVPDGATYLKLVREHGRFPIDTGSPNCSVYCCKSKRIDSYACKSEARTSLRDVRWIYMLMQCMILSAVRYVMSIGPRLLVWLIESLVDRELGVRRARNMVIRPVLWSYPMERSSGGAPAVNQAIVNGCCLVEEQLERCTFATGFYSIVYSRLYNLSMMFCTFIWCIFTNWLGSTAFVVYMCCMTMMVWHVCDSAYVPRWVLMKKLEGSRIGLLIAYLVLSFFVVYGAPLCHFLFLVSGGGEE